MTPNRRRYRDLPLPPAPTLEPGRATSDRIAIVDAREGAPLAGIRNTRARMAIIRERAREHFRRVNDAAKPPEPKGYTWRGWWYPRALVWVGVVIFGLAVNVALVFGLFRLFGGGQ